ncbi:MAG: hypothetical protein MJZ65_04130 [Paludibacteraceae bacterium]|nr:hypothetical protein [Paludibacteraceae bacterium]
MKKQYLAPKSEKVNLDPLMLSFGTEVNISFGGDAPTGGGGDAPARGPRFI